jgi:hypothetical protein
MSVAQMPLSVSRNQVAGARRGTANRYIGDLNGHAVAAVADRRGSRQVRADVVALNDAA